MATAPQLQEDLPAYPRQLNDISYTDPPTRLQTLDIWFPRPLEESPPERSVWIVYVHGGAWRDPLQTSTGILPTIQHLLSPKSSPTSPTSPSSSPSPALPHIAAIASLNYRLSPYLSHPTHPSAPDDEERNVQHPEHVRDVSRGLQYLAERWGVGVGKKEGEEDGTKKGYRWIGIGHSCGATLLLQHLSNNLSPPTTHSSKSTSTSVSNIQDLSVHSNSVPESLILLSGIYSLPSFLSSHTPPTVPPHIADIYRDIVTGAFGTNPLAWEAASPVSLPYPQPARDPDTNTDTDPNGNTNPNTKPPHPSSILLAYSPDDALVEPSQILVMRDALIASGFEYHKTDTHSLQTRQGEKKNGQARVVECRKLIGAHDEVWEQGDQIAELISEVLGREFGHGDAERQEEGKVGYW